MNPVRGGAATQIGRRSFVKLAGGTVAFMSGGTLVYRQNLP